MAKGVPIRLVQENGNTIELDATTMVLSTTRKVGGAALPWTGSRRIGMDWNINKAMINIQGVITDDREGTTAAAHKALINFGQTKNSAGNPTQWATTANLTALLGRQLRIQAKGTGSSSGMHLVPFINVTARADGGSTSDPTAYDANAGAGSTPTVMINTTNGTPEQVATAVAAYINAQKSSHFTATVVSALKANSDNTTSSADCAVSIVMSATGKSTSMRISTPEFKIPSGTTGGAYFDSPVIEYFSGGTDGMKKSAGDKVQDLYGIINNSTVGGAFLKKLRPSLNWRKNEVLDYVVGIQIPYNSILKTDGGDLYTARNFFMPTGLYYGKEKTSEGNDHPASVEFDRTQETTGIQGSVQKLDITYDAGESVYSFNMIFAPIDNMILS